MKNHRTFSYRLPYVIVGICFPLQEDAPKQTEPFPAMSKNRKQHFIHAAPCNK